MTMKKKRYHCIYTTDFLSVNKNLCPAKHWYNPGWGRNTNG